MSYKLFLDDMRWPKDVKWIELPLGPWAIVRDYDGFVRHIQRYGLPSFVTFDHDLADEHYLPEVKEDTYTEETGYDCAKWLVEYCIEKGLTFPEYAVHSMNPIGKQNIISYIENFKRTQ